MSVHRVWTLSVIAPACKAVMLTAEAEYVAVTVVLCHNFVDVPFLESISPASA